MRTFPLSNDRGRTVGFEIDNVLFLTPVAGVLRSVPAVTAIRVRPLFGRWGDVRVRFRYHQTECVILEPFGDSSRLWIVPADPEDQVDMGELERAFAGGRSR
jgi:hypothetical protein